MLSCEMQVLEAQQGREMQQLLSRSVRTATPCCAKMLLLCMPARPSSASG
jgi:hypothetical protein